VAIEPAAPTFACLRENLGRYAPGSRTVCAAVGSARGRQTLTYYPRAPANSSLHPDRDADDRARRVFLRNRGLPERWIDRFAAAAGEGVPVTVEVTTVSDVVRDLDLGRVDVLKIDVERAELQVLQGVAPEHWPAIRHVAVEVHDERGNLGRCRDLLAGLGFDVRVTQDPDARGTELYEIDASRR